MAALYHIRYKGGNTKTGIQHAAFKTDTKLSCHFIFLTRFTSCRAGMALKHTYEKAFSMENGMRRNVPKLVVAITDGRSQDEVKKSAARLQQAGMSWRMRYCWRLELHPRYSTESLCSCRQATASSPSVLPMWISWNCKKSRPNPVRGTFLSWTTLMLLTPSGKT